MCFDLSIIVNSGSSMSILNRRISSLIRNLSFQYSVFKVQFPSLFCKSGSHLSSHTVASIVLSAAYVLTVVFGMGTGVTPKRIATGNFLMHLASKQ